MWAFLMIRDSWRMCGEMVPTGLASLLMGSGDTEPLPEHVLY